MWRMTFFFSSNGRAVREFFSQGEVPKQTVKKNSRAFWHLPQLKHGPTQLNRGPKAWTSHRRMCVKRTLSISKLLTKKNNCEMCYCTYSVFIVPPLEKLLALLFCFLYLVYENREEVFFYTHKRLDKRIIFITFFCFFINYSWRKLWNNIY